MNFSKEEVVKHIGKNIRLIRIEKGMTIENLANESELEYSQISRIELGLINTSVFHIYKISKVLSVPVSRIFEFIS